MGDEMKEESRMRDTTGQQVKDEVNESAHGQVEGTQKVPRETSKVTIGKEAKTTAVGECKVSFPADTFTGAQSATMTTEIDTIKWPPGREDIKPTLYSTTKIFRKADVLELPTWCSLDDDNAGIERMLYNEDMNKWKVIAPVARRNESSPEFQSDQGDQYIGTSREEQSWMTSYVVWPILCFKNSKFVVALIRNMELDRYQLMENMKNFFGDHFTTKDFCPLPWAKTRTIDSCIKCVNPHQGFKFVASGSFTHDIQNIFKYAIPSYGLCQLESDAPKMNITLEFELSVGGTPLRKADCFMYCWEPVAPTIKGSGSLIGGVIQKEAKMKQFERGGIAIIEIDDDWSSRDVRSALRQRDVGYGRLTKTRAKPKRSKESVQMIGGVYIDQHEYSTDPHAGLLLIEENPVAPTIKGSGSLIEGVIQKEAKTTQFERGGIALTEIEDGWCSRTTDVRIRAISALAGNLVEVFVERGEKYKRFYRLQNTVDDIIAGIAILLGIYITRIRDSETEGVIDKDTQLSTLLMEKRLKILRVREVGKQWSAHINIQDIISLINSNRWIGVTVLLTKWVVFTLKRGYTKLEPNLQFTNYAFVVSIEFFSPD